MLKINLEKWVSITLASVFLISCAKDPSIRNVGVPDYFPAPVYNKAFNQAEFTLGKQLFYDPILSSDSSISCSSCHGQMHAFADHNSALSVGVNGKFGLRNSPSLFNLKWQPHFMADGGITHLEIMPLAPLMDSLEMNNSSIIDLLTTLNNNPNYRKQFASVYEKEKIDDQQLLFALAQFMGQLNSYQSKYDEVKQGNAEFTAQEKKGYQLFLANCNTCHTEPLFTNFSFKNNGQKEVYKDLGRFRITQNEKDRNTFKVPSLRNIHLTRPYLHDGSIRNLKEVVKRYQSPYPHQNLALELQDGIDLSELDIENILSFLGTLNDYQFTTNPKLAQP